MAANPTVEAGDAARTRSAVIKLKYVLDPYYSWNVYSVSEAELNSLITVAARGLPGLQRPRLGDARRRWACCCPGQAAGRGGSRPG